MENPFDIRVYDRDWQLSGFVTDPTYINMVPAWTDQGYGNFMLTAGNPHSAALQAPGARVICTYRGQNILSGPVRSRQGDVFGFNGVTYQVADWTQLILRNVIAWVDASKAAEPTDLSATGAGAWMVDPASAVAGTTAGQYGYIHWPDGSAIHGGLNITSSEQAIKYIVTKNLVERLGMPITVLPDLGRGGDPSEILPKTRWVAIGEVFTPILNFSGLGLRIWHDDGEVGLKFDVYEPGAWTQEIRFDSGIITDGTYTVSGPDVTRVIAGGPSGSDAAGRLIYGDEGHWPLNSQETDWGLPLENFIDATGYDLTWPDGTTDDHKQGKYFKFVGASGFVTALYNYLDQQIGTARTAGASSTGLSLKLAETETFHWGGSDGIQNGDLIKVRLSDGSLVTDQVTSAQLVFTRDDGFTCNPIVGDYTDDQDHELAKSIAALSRYLRRMNAFR